MGTGRAGPGESHPGFPAVRQLAGQSAILVSSGVVAYVGALVLNVLLARTIGTEGFGAWVIGFSIAQVLSTLGLLGVDWILLRQGSHYHGTGDTPRLRRTIHFAIVLSSGSLVVLGAILFGVSSLVADRVFHSTSVRPILQLTALIGPIIGLRQVLIFSTQAFKRMRDAALNRNILQPLVRLACSGAAIVISRSALAAYTGLLVAEVVLLIAAAFVLNRRIPLFGPTDRIEQKELVKFAVPAWGSHIVEAARAQLFPILLGSFIGVSASGVFAAARRIAVAPVSVIAAINQVYRPFGSDLFLQGRMAELGALFKSVAKWSFTVGLPLSALMVAFPREILSVFGRSFEPGSDALIVLGIGVLFQFGTGPVTVTLILSGRPRLALLDYLIVVGTEIGLAVWLIPPLGLMGAAVAKAAGTALNNLLPLAQVWVMLHLHPYRVNFWRPAAAVLLATGLAVIAVRVGGFGPAPGSAVLATAVLATTYLVLVLTMGLGAEDRALISSLRRRRKAAEPPPSPRDVSEGT